MDRLIEGYHRFRTDLWPRQRSRFEELSRQGQRPRAMVIACSDSRVDPQMIFDAGPGELFVVRNVANLVPPHAPDAAYHGTSAALEFGVRVLKVSELIVLGHAQCGGVQALLQGSPVEAGDFVSNWMQIAARARSRALRCEGVEEQQTACEQETVRLSLDNLMTFPWIADAVAAGMLRLHGCYYGVHSGRLLRLDDTGAFVPIPPAPAT
jgi:carbonic anhydrase